jgi:hypothetical protein
LLLLLCMLVGSLLLLLLLLCHETGNVITRDGYRGSRHSQGHDLSQRQEIGGHRFFGLQAPVSLASIALLLPL